MSCVYSTFCGLLARAVCPVINPAEDIDFFNSWVFTKRYIGLYLYTHTHTEDPCTAQGPSLREIECCVSFLA